MIDQFRHKLVDGMLANGFSAEYAEAVFGQIRGFGEYGFPESHAASFALLVYVSAWLKHHYPAAFAAALLNSQPMGFYAPAQLVRDAREHGVEVRPVDVNCSEWDCTLEDGKCKLQNANCKMQNDGLTQPIGNLQSPSLRLGFNMLLGVSSAHVERIEEARRQGPFCSMDDFARRTGLNRAVISRLAKAGTFGSVKLNRRAALWEALGQDQKKLPLFEQKGEECKMQNEKCKMQNGDGGSSFCTLQFAFSNLHFSHSSSQVHLPQMSAAEEVLADYRTAGLSLRAHPLEFLRAELDRRGVATAASLQTRPDGKPVCVAGIVLVRQRPSTAKGITFVTLEDETGTANLIIRPSIWRRYREAALAATVMLAHGCLQRQGLVIHVLTTKLEDLSPWMQQLGSQSRDFS